MYIWFLIYQPKELDKKAAFLDCTGDVVPQEVVAEKFVPQEVVVKTSLKDPGNIFGK